MKSGAIYEGLTKQEIIDLPTLSSSQFDDLKREDVADEEHIRVWVSHCEFMPDGSPQVTVERLVKGDWETEGFY